MPGGLMPVSESGRVLWVSQMWHLAPFAVVGAQGAMGELGWEASRPAWPFPLLCCPIGRRAPGCQGENGTWLICGGGIP